MINLMEQSSVIQGIYKIICIKNNKFYIGSGVNIDKRLKSHIGLLKRNKHENKYLQNCWNKYGEQNFRFEIIESVCDTHLLSIKEKWWLDNTSCCNRKIGFNISSSSHRETRRFIDLTGRIFERLSVNKYVGKDRWGGSKWLCQCECGKEKIIRGCHLKSGLTRSCGCLVRERIKSSNTTHGHSKNRKQSRTYKIWDSMKQRCANSNAPNYKDYGGRGITICDRWNPKKGGSFANFLADMDECPIGLTLDRINNNKLIDGYSPENCRWATKKEQTRNRRTSISITFNNITQPLVDWAQEYNIPYGVLWARIYLLEWPMEKALITPVGCRKKVLYG